MSGKNEKNDLAQNEELHADDLDQVSGGSKAHGMDSIQGRTAVGKAAKPAGGSTTPGGGSGDPTGGASAEYGDVLE
ncbi:MAG TPA: hypothetical protein DCG25_09625 [Acidimicrobiaceae bacterium]|nr:hypothetical protein [Acidimicrobiaceae bacterium]